MTHYIDSVIVIVVLLTVMSCVFISQQQEMYQPHSECVLLDNVQ